MSVVRLGFWKREPELPIVRNEPGQPGTEGSADDVGQGGPTINEIFGRREVW
jgi:hypothetical protein